MQRFTASILLSVLAASVVLGGCAESEQYRPRLFLSLPD